MNRRRTYQILTFIFIVTIIGSLIIPVYSEVMISKQNEENTSVTLDSSALQSEFPFDLTRNEFKFTPPISYDISDSETESPETSISARQPYAQILEVKPRNSNPFDPDLGTIKTITNPDSSDQFFRGTTVTVTGVLWSGLPGGFWVGETVYLYYNITKTTYESNKAFYDGNSQYEVGSGVTVAGGIFNIDLVTSNSTIDPFSKVGDITLLTWYRGGTNPDWAEGSPGDVTVEFYGQLEFDVNAVVSNPNATYSFTTQILYDNGTIVDVGGTNLGYVVDWTTYSAYDDSGTDVFASNQHVFSDTSPSAGTDTVSYSIDYDITQLPFSFFVKLGSATFNPSEHLTLTLVGSTEESALVDAYYNTGTGLSKLPMEIQIGDTFEIQATLNSSSGYESSKTITVIYYYEGSNHTSPDPYVTNSSGGIKFNTYLNPSANVSDISQGFIVYLQPVASEFPGARMIGDSLDSILTVNITTVRITIADTVNFYTVGLPIGYNVEIEDINGNLCPLARFQIDFTGEPSDFYFTTASGDRDVTSIVPSYAVQAPIEPITVTGLDYDGGTYKYYAPSSPTASDNFEMYYALSLTLTDNDGGAVLGGLTSVWNRTFWNDFEINNDYYELQALDQWGRNPEGARISITFAGEEAFFFVTAAQNWVRYDETHLGAGWDHNLAFTGDLIATGGDYAPATTITQTINIYGPDTEAPILVSVNFTPDPNSTATHYPYFNITFTVVATDAHSGVRSVIVYYDLYDHTGTYNSSASVTLTNIAPDTYEDNITMYVHQNQWYVVYLVEVKDYAGHGLDASGSRQILPAQWYDANFGYIDTEGGYYRVGDVHEPVELASPVATYSGNVPNPYVDISVFINDSVVYSGMWFVYIFVSRTNLVTDVFEANITEGFMTQVPSTNEWTYHLDLEYNYNYTWYYVATDLALPLFNFEIFDTMFLTTDDSDSPNIFGITVNAINGTADPDSVLTFNASVIDILTNVSTVTLNITISLGTTFVVEDYSIEMTRIGTSDIFTA
ncbi:MAG: hypothetical protein KAU62_11230, partial [Candidatus Heimdallarchaeota archaeon]|nr:hypothetical protein [Candidatus Heimdallarchaeota archaeon]MCK4611719.1 hypothetical protein [Candidatus Heimdallarchaeota archaeon]